MPHALRTPDGQLTSLHAEPQPGSQWLEPDHPDVRAFLGPADTSPDEAAVATGSRFANLDADLVRVLEDLIDVLITRNVIRVTDLPSEAQHKLFNRKHVRDRMQQHSLRLFGGEASPSAGDDIVPTEFGPAATHPGSR